MQDEFHVVDWLFARKILPQGPEKATFFLAYLLKSAREGHLCVILNQTLPSEILEGATLLPSQLFEHHLVQENERIYLRRNWECEQLFLRHFHRLKVQKPVVE